MRMFPPTHPVTITFPLHELIGLGLLYDRSPEDTVQNLYDDNGVYYGVSVSYASLRIAESIYRAVEAGDDVIERITVLRATLDQASAGL